MTKKHFTSQDARALINTYEFAIFPIHGTKDDGTCTCNNPKCTNIGKHPATPDGFKSASKDIEKVKRLWAGRKGLNVGVATGEASGIFVVDIDSAEGEIELAKIVTLPSTYTVTTGRGKHLYFKYPKDKKIKNGAHVIPGVDIRGTGGYVVGAGSAHRSGKIYECVNPLEKFAEAPQELFDLIYKDRAVTQPLIDTSPKLNLSNNDGWSDADVLDHLSYISPNMKREDGWIAVGMALKQEGQPFEVWDNWSSSGATYDPHEMRKVWNGFNNGGGVTYGTVVELAKQGGWKPKKYEKPIKPVATPAQDIIDEETGEVTQAKPKSKMYYIKGSEIVYEPKSRALVQDFMDMGAMSVVYGESNCGKTFFMSDVAYHVAEGKRWREKRVEGGIVVYVALEGLSGIKERVQAYKNDTGATLENFLVMPCAFDFLDAEGDVADFLALLEEIKNIEGDVKLIVIDTLARAMGGGDENSGEDMGMLVRHADAIREVSGAHICFVHHSGKDKARGSRGHSSLRAAVDTEAEVSREEEVDYSTVKTVKQREMSMGEDMHFELKKVSLGVNEYNEEKLSCVVVPTEAREVVKAVKLTPIQRFIYDGIVRALDDYGKVRRFPFGSVKSITFDEMRKTLEAKGFKEFMGTENKSTAEQIKAATQTARIGLQSKNKVSFDKGFIWLMGDNDGMFTSD